MEDFGRILIIIGATLVFSGIVILVAIRYFPWLGNLPGDFRLDGDNYKIYFPFATMLVISVLGTILLNIFIRIFRR
ncbi:MAG: DUF2905 domain-containing protein [Anaerolineae bacterium]|nr:DUF2905 domain-containing protein [Anaerolineae bacterium]MCO5188714.1 DUF2905 domain-containing protein [Anaerolineae bacterium]MCO5193609.1 DUF2905 domain-containing protein [Anaerolineae bacterium]MCO5197472.1 DUF2905 domain-containing protein [Anaerolineae bacterium]MCO5205692.1 DUF2905 domain-containing protein [Anaerolineae bacterium]